MSDFDSSFPPLPRPPASGGPPGGLPPPTSTTPLPPHPFLGGDSHVTPRYAPAAPPGFGPGYGPGPGSPPPMRSGMAVAGFVMGLLSILLFVTFVVPVLAIVFGLIGASAIKKSAGRLTGIKMARAGWILGMLGLAAFVAVVIAVAVDESNDTDVDLDELEIGSCYDLPDSDGELQSVSTLEPIPCDEPHTGELFHQFDMNPGGDRDYPGEDEAFAEAGEVCSGEAWTDYVGISYAQSEYDVFIIVPVSFSWKVGGGEASCFVVTVDGSDLTERVEGSGR